MLADNQVQIVHGERQFAKSSCLCFGRLPLFQRQFNPLASLTNRNVLFFVSQRPQQIVYFAQFVPS